MILTLLVNATTIKYLLKALGMSDISNARRLTMSTAVRRVREAKMRAVSMLKSDRFLADANWDIVEQKTEITDPYHSEYDELEVREIRKWVTIQRGSLLAACPNYNNYINLL